MIINTQDEVLIDGSTEDEAIDFSVDLDSLDIMMRGFSDNLYSNKIGSVVREIASNAWDANAESGTDRHVVITLSKPDGFTNGSISFTDYGIGLSTERIRKVYAKYFASTKRGDNNQIGGKGIGCKSPFAVTDVFSLITRNEGTEYHYLIHKGELRPRIELLHQVATDELSGTTVTIPIRSAKDGAAYEKELGIQLRYMDTIDFVGVALSNDYLIYRGDYWIHRHGDGATQLEICVGTVRYPLSADMCKRLNIGKGIYNNNEWKVPDCNFAIKFEVGEIDVTLSREEIDYNERTCKVIEDRFIAMKLELMVLANKNNQVDEFVEYVELMRHANQIRLAPDVWLNTNKVLSPGGTYVPFKGTGIVLNMTYNPLFFISAHTLVRPPKRQGEYRTRHSNDPSPLWDVIKDSNGVGLYRLADKMVPQKNRYLLDQVEKSFATYKVTDPETGAWTWKATIGTADPAEIALYKKHAMAYVIKHTKSYAGVVVPQEWIEAQKKPKGLPAAKSTDMITIRHLQRGSTKMDDYRVDQFLDSISREKRCMVVYGTLANAGELGEVARILSYVPVFTQKAYRGYDTVDEFDSRYVRVIQVAEANVKYFRDHPRCMSVEQVWVKRFNLLRRTLAKQVWAMAYPLLAEPFTYMHWETKSTKLVADLNAVKTVFMRHSRGLHNTAARYNDKLKLKSLPMAVNGKLIELDLLVKEKERFEMAFPLVKRVEFIHPREVTGSALDEYISLKLYVASTYYTV